MSDDTEWVRAIVHGWIAKIDDVESLRSWIDACHKRVEALGGPRRFGLDTARARTKAVLVDGKWYVVTAVQDVHKLGAASGLRVTFREDVP